MNIIKLCIVALMLIVTSQIYGQEGPTKPAKVDGVTGKDYYQHGYNTTGQDLPREERDSVTVTSTIRYFVLPDRAISPNWYDASGNILDINNTTNLNSIFNWSLKNSRGTSNNSTTPILSVTWTSTGIDSVKVKEAPTAGAACAGNETSIPVAVILKPTFTFNQLGTPLAYADAACYSQAQVTAGIPYSFPLTLTTQSSQVLVDYIMVFTPISGTTVTTTITNVPVTGGTLPLTLGNAANTWGKYEVTVTKVTDRISRKSSVLGDVIAAGAKFTYTVLKPAQTGPIYRLPNQGNY